MIKKYLKKETESQTTLIETRRSSILRNSADGSKYISPNGNKVFIWDNTMRKVFAELDSVSPISFACLSPDGSKLITSTKKNKANVWDLRSGKALTTPIDCDSVVTVGSFSADGSKIVMSCADGTALVCDISTKSAIPKRIDFRRTIGPNKSHRIETTSIRFSPDGSKFVITTKSNDAYVWDAATGKLLAGPMFHKAEIYSANFSPDGKKIVTASADKTARIWEVATGKPLAEPMFHNGEVYSANFSPDGKKIVTASGDKTAHIWNAFKGLPITEPMKHNAKVLDANFSPDGLRVVTSSSDKEIRMWDVSTGRALSDPIMYDDVGCTVHFSKDGSKLVVKFTDRPAVYLDVAPASELPAPQSLISIAEAIGGNRLNPQGVLEPVKTALLLDYRKKFQKTIETDPYSKIFQSFFSEKSIMSSDFIPEDMVSRLAENLSQQGIFVGRPVFISPVNFYDARSRLSLPLCFELCKKLVSEIEKRGYSVQQIRPSKDAIVLKGTFSKFGFGYRIHLNAFKIGRNEPKVLGSASENIPIPATIDTKALEPNLASWTRYLVLKLELNSYNSLQRTVHVAPFQIKGKRASDELGDYLSTLFQSALFESLIFHPLDEQETLEKMTVESIRNPIKHETGSPQAGNNSKLSLTSDLIEADAEMRGTAWLHKDKLEVRIRIIDHKGQQLSVAAADIPSHLFPKYLFEVSNGSATESPADSKERNSISKDGLKVELAASRGGSRPFYRDGEHIALLIRVNLSAYVYVFYIDSQGNAMPLYPIDESGNLTHDGHCGHIIETNFPLILPQDGCAYDLVVAAPYGTEKIWIAASETPMDFKTGLGFGHAKAIDLVKHIRALGLSSSGGYAEDQIEIVTGPSRPSYMRNKPVVSKGESQGGFRPVYKPR